MKRTRVGAFTILEMLINIMIMSIIIGMVYFVYSSFSKQVSFYQKDVEKENGLSSFCLRLKTDFFLADRVTGDSDSFEVIFYDTRRIYYQIGNGYLFRTQGNDKDSLKVDKVGISTIIEPISGETLVQKAVITAFLFEEPLEITVAKKYPNLLDYKTGHGH